MLSCCIFEHGALGSVFAVDSVNGLFSGDVNIHRLKKVDLVGFFAIFLEFAVLVTLAWVLLEAKQRHSVVLWKAFLEPLLFSLFVDFSKIRESCQSPVTVFWVTYWKKSTIIIFSVSFFKGDGYFVNLCNKTCYRRSKGWSVDKWTKTSSMKYLRLGEGVEDLS